MSGLVPAKKFAHRAKISAVGSTEHAEQKVRDREMAKVRKGDS